MRLLNVGVLLSGREQFSPYYGGALARWTYEVYSRLKDRVAATVFGYPTAAENLYDLPHRTTAAWRACDAISRIPFIRRYTDHIWLRSLIKSLDQFDVVHVHNRPQWAGELRRLGYKGNIWLHLQNDHLGHWTKPQLDELATQLDGVAVCSDYLCGTFADRSPELGARTRIVFNGVDMQLFSPQNGFREPKTIFFVGRFQQEKGIRELIRAYDLVLSRHPDAKLVIGGSTGFGVHRETDYVRSVREMAEVLIRNKAASIEFPGYIHHEKDLPQWFRRASIFTSPSLFQEPFGLVNAEAMACGVPVVGSKRGGIPEVLGDTGVLVDPEATEEYANALSDLLDRPEYRASLARAAHQRCREMFDWKVIASNWAKILETTGTKTPARKDIPDQSVAHSSRTSSQPSSRTTSRPER